MYTGNDNASLDSYGLSLLTNDEVIAVDQGGHPVHPVFTNTQQQVWYSDNGDGTFNVALFNLGTKAAAVSVGWSELGLDGPAAVRDLWSHRDLGVFAQSLDGIELEPHASRLFKVTAQSGTASVNDDDTGISYMGNWTRNGGEEVAAQSQDLSVSVVDSDTNPTPSSSGDTVTLNDTDGTISYDSTFGYSSGLGDYGDDIH